jgi:hypothetical protein
MQMPRAGGSTTNSAERRGEYETFHRDIIRFCTHVERNSVHIFKKDVEKNEMRFMRLQVSLDLTVFEAIKIYYVVIFSF